MKIEEEHPRLRTASEYLYVLEDCYSGWGGSRISPLCILLVLYIPHKFWRNLIVFLKIKLMRHGRPRSRSSGGRKDRDRHPRINHKQEALRVSLTLVRTACF